MAKLTLICRPNLFIQGTPWCNRCRETGAFVSRCFTRATCIFGAFLEFLLTCFYLHSLKVSQLEKESPEQQKRCKMLSAELENASNLKDVLEETVLQWKSFGIPECDVEVHATDSGQFLPPMYLPMTPRDSNNLKEAKDVRADGPSDASTTMPNRLGGLVTLSSESL